METWSKNRWMFISLIYYSLTTMLFGFLGMNLIFLGISLFAIPYIFNFKINSESFGYGLLGGLIFGLVIIPITSAFKIENSALINIESEVLQQIIYWSSLLLLNISYSLHRSEYIRRKKREDLSDKRDSLINSIISPVRNKFIQ